jgi:hypothetical protein
LQLQGHAVGCCVWLGLTICAFECRYQNIQKYSHEYLMF